MSKYFLGMDIGSTKTHALISNRNGEAVGFGSSGPGNHEVVGYDGLVRAMGEAIDAALDAASLHKEQIAAGGFGIAGYDWPSEREETLAAIDRLGLEAPVDAFNDANLGLLAGSPQGWGVAVVSGTGCNCRGWNETRGKTGMVTGAGLMMGEAAGASELMMRVVWALSRQWSRRSPFSMLAPLMVEYYGAADLANLVEGFSQGVYHPHPAAAPLVFEAAAFGDKVALDLVIWAGEELGAMVIAVAKQLEILERDFDVVMVGSMFNGGPMLIQPLKKTVRKRTRR